MQRHSSTITIQLKTCMCADRDSDIEDIMITYRFEDNNCCCERISELHPPSLPAGSMHELLSQVFHTAQSTMVSHFCVQHSLQPSTID